MADCLFCRIASGELPSPRVWEDEHLIAIRDIQPAAPTHLLVIPREHVESVEHLEDAHRELAGRLLLAARDIARQQGLAEGGYRLVINTGPDGGQTVPHLHLHVLGGAAMRGHGTR
jgi:histidine triad (HIT) family protein